MGYMSVGNLSIHADLLEFVNDQLLAGTSISSQDFWQGFDEAVHKLAQRIGLYWHIVQSCRQK